MKNLYQKILIIALTVSWGLTPLAAHALALVDRSVTVASSAANAVTTYTFAFTPGTSGNIGSIRLQICDSPLEVVGCVNTGDSNGASFTSNSASITGQTGISGFTAGTGTPPAPTTNTFWLTNGTPQNVTNATPVTITLDNVNNPTAANKQYYVRITTFSDSSGSTQVDFGAVGLDTTNQIIVSGTMPESLVFCVGTSGSNCTNITGSAVALGTFTPTGTNTGTSVMSASTNAGSGYVITINGTTMTSGANTIDAMGTQSANSNGCAPSCTSNIGSSQFGTNVRANTTPSVGANVSGPGGAAGVSGYDTADSFRFFDNDIVASVGGPTQANLFTNSYIVNVGGDQAAGVYTSTLTYICTATF